MKKIILLSALVLGVFAFSNKQVINAEEESTSTGATITFKGDNTDPTNPVDPTDPDNPGTGPGTGMEGPLSLDYVPEMTFGTQEITGNVETYDLTNLQPYVQVTDKRGSGAGWKVSVSLTSFQNTDASKSFDGVITFKNGETATTTGNNSVSPTASNPVTITSGNSEQKLVGTTAANQGMGTWVTRWFPTENDATLNDSVQLTVNTANVSTDSYKANLNWIISNAP
ncbi:WxL domain-containing protein [Breznakia pachnodae]|uniref:WxL domain-containing protein n=1 Tax=Breznakia pachnodae TaxID=265178 RepID=A0ABU0E9A4_9FIRM|nr:WxL domain-containing protein [Breznakia pachnodae]MDQ0363293.1 hypothetical protein [Breznakia pachnodae]